MGRATVCILLGLCLGGPSFAQSIGVHPIGPSDRGFVELSSVFALSPSGDEVSARHLSPQVAAGIRLTRSLSATLTVAAAYTSFRVYSEGSRSSSRMGNPLLGIHYALVEEAGGALRVGVALGAPLVTVPGTIPTNTAAAYSDGVSVQARGMQGYWLWARNAVPIVLLLGGERNLGSGLVIGSELQPAFLFSVNSAPSRLALLFNASVGYRLGPLTPALRGQVLWSSRPLSGHDFAQSSVVGSVRLELSASLFLRAESSVNLDGPYGLGGVS
ncbi:MAG TPA: hypothetical protein VNA24_34550, partial [Hyalangium sp.]|nr:hypothetical protein [Hyalangium sp.]